MSSTADNSIICTSEAIDLYNVFTNAGVDIFNLQAIRFECDPTEIDSGLVTLGKYYDVASEKYNHFVSQYDKRFIAHIALYNGSTLIDEYPGFLIFKKDGRIQMDALASSYWPDNTEITLAYVQVQNIHLDYSES